MRKTLTMIMIPAFFMALYIFHNYAFIEIEPDKVPLAAPSSVSVLMPTASGSLVKKNEKAEIDYSNTKDGYVMVRYLSDTGKGMRAIVKSPGGGSYTYNLSKRGVYEIFPISEGNGSYQVSVYESIKDSKYSTIISVTFQVVLADEFAPFLRPNQYVNYRSGSDAVSKAAEITRDANGIMAKISSVYSYVTRNITYDKELAKTVQSGYLPDVDAVMKKRKGICFDYAALMSVMLRSQQIPTKLVVGYVGNAYHAWINVYSKEMGWIDKVIYFDGASWKLMDPTFAASKVDQSSANISYTAKFVY